MKGLCTVDVYSANRKMTHYPTTSVSAVPETISGIPPRRETMEEKQWTRNERVWTGQRDALLRRSTLPSAKPYDTS